MKLTKLFKGMQITDVSQPFHSKHKAWDVVSRYGTILCAVERLRIEKIMGDTFTPTSDKNTVRGYGVWCTGLETGNVYVYWHVLPVLPVNVGDIVERGKIVAFMGNSGQVYSGGQYVPIELRNHPHKPGTHVHFQIYSPGHPVDFLDKDQIDPATLIDFDIEPTYSVADQLRSYGVVFGKITGLLRPRA